MQPRPVTATPALAARLRTLFDSRVRARGDDYHDRRAVKIEVGTRDFVGAWVRGNDDYFVLLVLEGEKLAVTCDCPYFDDGDLCKHLWATIRAADDERYLSGVQERPRLRVRPSTEEEIFGYGEDEEGEEELGDGSADEDGEEWEEGSELDEDLPDGNLLASRRSQAGETDWATALDALERRRSVEPTGAAGSWPRGREILYVIDVAESLAQSCVTVGTWVRQQKANGEPGVAKQRAIRIDEVERLPDADDRRIVGLLHGASEGPVGWYYAYTPSVRRFRIPLAANDTLIPLLCATGRCFLRRAAHGEIDPTPLEWDDGPPWRLHVDVREAEDGAGYVLWGSLRRYDETIDLAEPPLLFAGGLAFERYRVVRLDDGGVFPWIAMLRDGGPLKVPARDRDRLVEKLFSAPVLPELDLPPEFAVETVEVSMKPRLRLKAFPQNGRKSERDQLLVELSFDYDGVVVERAEPGAGVYDRARQRRVVRDRAAEDAGLERLLTLGVQERKPVYVRGPGTELRLARSRMPPVVRELLREEWHVEAEGKLYRQATSRSFGVKTGVDWFDLESRVEFDDQDATLPELLAALRRGEGVVPLGDGSVGLLPEEWLRRIDVFTGLGTPEGERVRFRRAQVGVIDALLAAEPEATWDEASARARDEFQRFAGIEPEDASPAFEGTLRPYQREGLGWLGFLERFGFGGCLADDMGLGKTVQVLALLEARRDARARGAEGSPRPSLVVVPRSLLFNWRREAERFTPALRVLEHAGRGRRESVERLDEHDLVLTTYGTLRRDVEHLKDVRFDWVVLDEAQAIKNARTATAKATRLLSSRHRLALSGTPIENHLGELWSLFEFLNPGMLGSASVFLRAGAGARELDEEGRELLSRAIRPFILRRTKAQVARELPPRHEQTIYADLDRSERRRYDELRDHYRNSLLSRVDRSGIAKSKIHVFEALLRLRQAACHPGLLDRSLRAKPSAKLEILLSQLAQVLDGDHKAIVFSQFTSLLGIVRDRLEREGVGYEYLDGRTRKREMRVDRFQNDPNCRLFLVSLKAGGLGLNLTAADYVYLLDPWWNPAVEAQAIDRTHRIGQTRRVFAYRLIARDTVEEKVLALQESKRELADSVIRADDGLVRNLTRADLELLLS